MTDIIPIANFRTRLEAELAARLLEGAAVPYVINSPEGMFHGPLGARGHHPVRADDVDLARGALAGELPRTPPRVVRVATCPTAEAADRVRGALNAVGIPALSMLVPADTGADRHGIFIWTGRST